MADVSTPSPEWEEDEARRALPLALYRGIAALKEDAAIDTLRKDPSGLSVTGGNRRWLWPNPGEMDLVEEAGALPETVYAKRIRRLRLNNVYRFSLSSAAAIPYRNPVVATAWPEVIEAKFEQVDGHGNDITDFARMASIAKMFAGIHFGLVQVAEDGSDVFWQQVPAAAVRYCVWGREGGRVRLLQANLETTAATSATLPDDPNAYEAGEGASSITVYRAGMAAGENYRVLQYDKDPHGGGYLPAWEDWRTPGRGGVRDIPLVPWYSSWDTPYRSPPRFEDAAYVQMEMIRQQSELDDMIRRAKHPLNVFSGVIPESKTKGYLDDGRAVFLHDPAARGSLVQLDASAIKTMADEIERGETQVRMACMDPMVMTPTGGATATEIGLREVRAATWLGASAKSDEASLYRMGAFTAALMGLEGSSARGQVKLPSGFMEVFSSQEKTAALLRGLFTDGLLSRETTLGAIRDLEVGLPEDLDPAEEVARIRSEIAATGGVTP